MIEKPHLEISFVLDEGDLYIVISDDGLGMEEETLQKLLYGDSCYMQVRSKRGYGTEIEIKLTVGEVL